MSYFDKNISDSELGAKVRESQRRHAENVKKKTPQWKKEGENFRHLRDALKVSRRELSGYIGTCAQVIAKFENGNYIQRRLMFQQSAHTALEFIQMKRNNFINGNFQK